MNLLLLLIGWVIVFGVGWGGSVLVVNISLLEDGVFIIVVGCGWVEVEVDIVGFKVDVRVYVRKKVFWCIYKESGGWGGGGCWSERSEYLWRWSGGRRVRVGVVEVLGVGESVEERVVEGEVGRENDRVLFYNEVVLEVF